MTIYCLGPKNTFSDLVSQQAFPDSKIEYLSSFTSVVDSVKSQPDAIGVLAVENSSTSSVHEVIDLVFKNNILVIGEAYINVRLHLIGSEQSSLGEITKVYSKGEALLQCTDFIYKHELETQDTSSTSSAIDEVMRNHKSALISGRQILANGGLKILQENVGNVSPNRTRFLFISQQQQMQVTSDSEEKMTVLLRLPHKQGSLAKLLTAIAKENGNLSKIESRPIPGTDWEYAFWLDIVISDNLDALKEAIRQNSLEYNIIGIYQKGPTYES